MKLVGSVLLLDLGSRKIHAAVITADEDVAFEIPFMGEFDSQGCHGGAVSDLNSAVSCIQEIVETCLEETQQKRFTQIWVGHSGRHIRSDNIAEVQSLAPNRAVTERLENQMQQRAEHHVPADHDLLHSFLRSSSIDGLQRDSAVGLMGTRLVSRFHMVYTRLAVLNNLKQVFQKAGYDVDRFVFNGYAASLAVLDNNEKFMGCLVVHLGSSTTDYVVYQEGQPFLCGSLSEGWSRMAKDVAVGVHIPIEQAEGLIKSDGSTTDILISEDRALDIRTFFGERSRLTRRHLAKIMGAAIDEILCEVRDNLKSTICRGHLPAGVIFTGGGATTNGLTYSAEHVFGVMAKVGDPLLPGKTQEFPPSWAAIIGLIMHAANEFKPKLRPETVYEYATFPVKSLWKKMFPGAKDPGDPEGEPIDE